MERVDSPKNKRDLTVEMIRIIAIFIVICLHTASWYKSGNQIIVPNLLLYSFLQDGVPMFWFITGMFLFRKGNSFSKNMERTLKSILIPAGVLVIIVAIFAPWIEGKSNIVSCLDFHALNCKRIVGSVLRWSTAGLPLSGHLWFVFAYLKIMLWYPLVKYICVDEDNANKVRRGLIVLALLAELINDLQKFGTLPTGKIIPFTIFGPSLLYVILGHEIALRRKQLKNKNFVRIGGCILYILSNLLRFVLAKFFFDSGINTDYFLHIENVLSIFSSVSLMLVLLSFDFESFESHRLTSIIYKIASLTFPVYLLHRVVYTKLNAIGVRSFMYSFAKSNLIFQFVVFLIYALIVYFISLILSLMVMRFIHILKSRNSASS